MKKVLVIFIAFVVMSSYAKAQVMTKGDNALNFGIGVPALGAGVKMSMPAIVAAFDHGFSDKLGIGYITGGAQLAFSGGGNTIWGVDYSYTYLTVGPRAAYHFDFYEMTGGKSAFEKLDIYAGVLLGFTIATSKYDDGFTTPTSSTNVSFTEDVFIGIRYSFSGSLGVYAETGYNVSFLNAGLTLRF
ncbi:MAG: hypothetical protein ABFS35_05115 [Bacteroidota bacterium]